MFENDRLCIIPCGSSKVWDSDPNAGPQQAKDVYTGTFAKACQRYAITFFEHWVILSAKHGFLFPNDIVQESYNVSFVKPTSETIRLEMLNKQAQTMGLFRYREITVLGGRHYVDMARALFHQGQTLILPLRDCKGIGYMIQRLNLSVTANQPADIRQEATTNDELHKTVAISSTHRGKYAPLFDYLATRQEKSTTLHIGQIEAILGFKLPVSSVNYRAWWSNDVSHSQANAWLSAGWEVDKVSIPFITFKKTK